MYHSTPHLKRKKNTIWGNKLQLICIIIIITIPSICSPGPGCSSIGSGMLIELGRFESIAMAKPYQKQIRAEQWWVLVFLYNYSSYSYKLNDNHNFYDFLAMQLQISFSWSPSRYRIFLFKYNIRLRQKWCGECQLRRFQHKTFAKAHPVPDKKNGQQC